jgi:hypothetical protein
MQPSETFSVTIQGNTYETSITMGKMRDFELNKITLSSGFYSSIQDVTTLNTIDSLSAIYAFFPDVKKDAKVTDPSDLKPNEMKEIFQVMEGFFKWYMDWKKFMSEPSKVEEKKSEKED